MLGLLCKGGLDVITKAQLEALQAVDIKTASLQSLVDITAIEIDQNAPLIVKAQAFFDQIKNPYAFRVGDFKVKVEFTSGGLPLSDALMGYLHGLRAGY